MLLRHDTIDLAQRDAQDLEALSKTLYRVHNKIFSGVDQADFHYQVFGVGADWSKLRIYREAAQRTVGYAAMHRYERQLSLGSVSVFRAEAGLLPGFRAHSATFYFYMLELLKYRLVHPLRNIYYLGTLVHPSSYVVFARYFKVMYPHHARKLDAKTLALICELADTFHAPPVDNADPLIRDVGWATRVERPYWQQTDDLDVAYFRHRNPGYRQGHGLAVLVPLTFANLSGAVFRHVLGAAAK